jgi:hypothetical protein
MMRTEWLWRQQPVHKTISVAQLRDQLYDAITDLLHAHRGDTQAVLGELAAALGTARGYHATDFDDDFRVFDVTDPDEIARLDRDDEGRLVELSPDAYRLLCGLVQPADVVGRVGNHAANGAWDELREAFPLADYATGPDVVHVLMSSPIRRESEARDRVIDDVTEHPAVAEAVVTKTTKTADGWDITVAVRPVDDEDVEDLADTFTLISTEA